MNKRILSVLFLFLSTTLFWSQETKDNSDVIQLSIETSEKPIRILEKQEIPNNQLIKNELNSISDYNFMYQYYKTIESSLNRNRKTGKLGNKKIDGLKSGYFEYKCHLSGWNKVTITMKYYNYCDYDFIVNGETTVKVNWSANGSMSGEIRASGPAEGTIKYNLIINNGIESEGYYMVAREQNGYDLRVPSELVLAFADREIQLDEKCTAKK